jgi:MraZ protein
MSSFTGSETSAVDAKGRINVPARLRRGLSPEAADTFTIVRGPEGCLKMFPLDEWRRYVEHIETYSLGDNPDRNFKRRLFDSAHETIVDGQGRVSLTTRLMELAGITGQVKLLGMNRHIELWDPKRFQDGPASDDGSEGSYDEGYDRMERTIQEKRNPAG